jgi:hypothetical protein
MTTLADYAARLAAHLNLSDGSPVSVLNTADLQELTDAANAGIQEFYIKAAPHLKQTLLTAILPAPSTVSIGVTAGLASFTGFTPTSLQNFCTIVINGEQNVLTGGNNLLYPFTGGATGTYTATIYGDAAAFANEAQLDQLFGDPTLADGSRLCQRTHDDPLWRPRNQASLTLGRPRHYSIEEYGQTGQGRPWIALRVRPMPDLLYRISIVGSLTAFVITPAQMTSTAIYVPGEDRFVATFFVPLALGYLTRHRLWKLPETKAGVLAAAQAAIASAKFLPRRISAGQNYCGTPFGY